MSAPRADGPIRVALLIASLDIGGAERQLVRLANGLDRARFEPLVLTYSGLGPLSADLRPDVELLTLDLPLLRDARALRWPYLATRITLAVARQLRSWRPQVVHGYMQTAYVLGALAGGLARVPAIVAGRRGLDSYQRLPKCGRPAARFANRLISVHICNSDAVRAYALAHEPDLSPDRVVVVHNGIDARDLEPVSLPPGWRTPGAVLGLMAANFHDYKGHRLLLTTLAENLADVPLRVVCLGLGAEERAISRLVNQLGLQDRVLLAGSRPDADRLAHNFDFSLLASSEEGFPNSLLEAMSAGIPVIGPRVGGVPELVRDGVDGLLFEPDQPADLARCLRRLATDPDLRRRLGGHARDRAEAEFSSRAMISRTEEIYGEALGKRRAAA